MLEQVASHYPARIAKVKVDEFMDLAMEFNVRQIPTMLVFQNQKQITRRIGSVKNVDVILEMIP
jgi:thioredoxin-like negative regulator of GroEL